MGRKLLQNFGLGTEGKTELFMLMLESDIIALPESRSGSKHYKNQIPNFRVRGVNQGMGNQTLYKQSWAVYLGKRVM